MLFVPSEVAPLRIPGRSDSLDRIKSAPPSGLQDIAAFAHQAKPKSHTIELPARTLRADGSEGNGTKDAPLGQMSVVELLAKRAGMHKNEEANAEWVKKVDRRQSMPVVGSDDSGSTGAAPASGMVYSCIA